MRLKLTISIKQKHIMRQRNLNKNVYDVSSLKRLFRTFNLKGVPIEVS